jgi:hypothetical protein
LTTGGALLFVTESWIDPVRWLPLVMPIVTIVALLLVRAKISAALRRVPQLNGSIWRFVKNLKVNQFIDMMETRVTSLAALASNVFMRRIRRLLYSSVMSDSVLTNRVVPVSIYNLRIAGKRAPPLDWLNPTEGMRSVAMKAQTIPTTLWFTNREQLRDLIAAGQNTVCRKLLVHILQLHENDPTKIPEHQRPLFEAAHAFFQQLRQDPYAFAGPPIQDDTGPHPS